MESSITDAELKDLLLQFNITDNDIKGHGKNGRVLKSDRMKVYQELQNSNQFKSNIKSIDHTPLPDDVILNIILNTPPFELSNLYAINKRYQKILNNAYTLDLLSNQYFEDKTKLKTFNEFIKSYNAQLKQMAGLSIDLQFIYNTIVPLVSKPIEMKFLIQITAVIEYMMAEIFEVSGTITRAKRSDQDIVTVSDVKKAIKNDEELNKTLDLRSMKGQLPSFNKSLYLILSQVHPKIKKIEPKAIKYINHLLYYLIKKIVNQYNQNLPFESIKDILVGALAQHAISEAFKSINKWENALEY